MTQAHIVVFALSVPTLILALIGRYLLVSGYRRIRETLPLNPVLARETALDHLPGPWLVVQLTTIVSILATPLAFIGAGATTIALGAIVCAFAGVGGLVLAGCASTTEAETRATQIARLLDGNFMIPDALAPLEQVQLLAQLEGNPVPEKLHAQMPSKFLPY